MARNYVQEGDVLEYTAGAAAIASGAVVLIGKRIGVANGNIAAGATGVLSVTGVWAVAKLAADAIAEGDLLYWDAANSRLTATAANNTQAGFATAAAGAGATVANIKINA